MDCRVKAQPGRAQWEQLVLPQTQGTAEAGQSGDAPAWVFGLLAFCRANQSPGRMAVSTRVSGNCIIIFFLFYHLSTILSFLSNLSAF